MKLTIQIPCNKAAEAVRNITIASRIIQLVSRHCNISIADLECRSKQWEFCWPRWIAISLIRRHTTLSTTIIGRLFNRDHGTILHALKAVTAEAATNPKSARQLTRLAAKARDIRQPQLTNVT